jgi:hypothetical protein
MSLVRRGLRARVVWTLPTASDALRKHLFSHAKRAKEPRVERAFSRAIEGRALCLAHRSEFLTLACRGSVANLNR